MSKKNGKPSPKGSNGRKANGQFEKGWKGGNGNPLGKQVNELRQVLIEATTPERMRKLANVLYNRAVDGDMFAMRELLSRVVGKPADALDADKLVDKIIVFDRDQNRYAGLVMRIGDGDVSPEARNAALIELRNARNS